MSKKKRGKTAGTAKRAKVRSAKRAPVVEKPDSMEELLERVPDKEYLSTRDIQKIFGVHEVTVYRWKAEGDLGDAYRRRSAGRAIMFKRKNVVDLIHSRYTPEPVEKSHAKHKKVGTKKKSKRSATKRKA